MLPPGPLSGDAAPKGARAAAWRAGDACGGGGEGCHPLKPLDMRHDGRVGQAQPGCGKHSLAARAARTAKERGVGAPLPALLGGAGAAITAKGLESCYYHHGC